MNVKKLIFRTMITTQNLKDLGFNEILDVFSGKQVGF
jgi:hypothetical protein